VYLVQVVLRSRFGKQRLYALDKSTALHKIWIRIWRVSAAFASNRWPFSKGRGSVEVDFYIFSRHGRCVSKLLSAVRHPQFFWVHGLVQV
jgi:hypothetical protein